LRDEMRRISKARKEGELNSTSHLTSSSVESESTLASAILFMARCLRAMTMHGKNISLRYYLPKKTKIG